MSGSKLKLVSTGPHSKACRVWLDNNEITNSLRSISIFADCRDVVRADLSLLIKEMDIDGDAVVSILETDDDRDAELKMLRQRVSDLEFALELEAANSNRGDD